MYHGGYVWLVIKSVSLILIYICVLSDQLLCLVMMVN